MDDGALVEPLAVSLRAANLSPISSGSRVLVIGEGPIGLGVIFWAKRLGATKIAMTGLTREREDLARAMGADFFFQAGDGDLKAEIDQALGGAPDIVFECVGAPGLIAQSIDQVSPRAPWSSSACARRRTVQPVGHDPEIRRRSSPPPSMA